MNRERGDNWFSEHDSYCFQSLDVVELLDLLQGLWQDRASASTLAFCSGGWNAFSLFWIFKSSAFQQLCSLEWGVLYSGTISSYHFFSLSFFSKDVSGFVLLASVSNFTFHGQDKSHSSTAVTVVTHYIWYPQLEKKTDRRGFSLICKSSVSCLLSCTLLHCSPKPVHHGVQQPIGLDQLWAGSVAAISVTTRVNVLGGYNSRFLVSACFSSLSH